MLLQQHEQRLLSIFDIDNVVPSFIVDQQAVEPLVNRR